MPLETPRSLLALALLAGALAGAARAGTPAAGPKYLAELAELTGKHPHDLIRPERLGDFRASFAERYPDLAAGFPPSCSQHGKSFASSELVSHKGPKVGLRAHFRTLFRSLRPASPTPRQFAGLSNP